MDKYSVKQEPEDPKVKTAAKQGVCPECGKGLEKDANVSKCPTHGTAPFEQKRRKTDGEASN